MKGKPQGVIKSPIECMLASFDLSILELYQALADDEGLVICSDLMLGIMTRCRRLPSEIVNNLSVSEKLELHEHCQNALQAVAYEVNKTFALWPDPVDNLDLTALRYYPELMTLPSNQLGYRLLSIQYRMDELWHMRADDLAVLKTARKVLRLCSGAEFRLHGLDGGTINTNAIDFANMRAKRAQPMKRGLFDIAVLTLMCLARSHSAWCNATLPAKEQERAVMLWNMAVPGTGNNVPMGKAVSRKRWLSSKFSELRMSSAQEQYLNGLHSKLIKLQCVPRYALPLQNALTQSLSRVSSTAEQLYARAQRSVDIVRLVIAGRQFESDSLDEKYIQAIFRYGQDALTDLFLAVKTYFGILAEPTATQPSVFEPARNERPKPVESDAKGIRAWHILQRLDQVQINGLKTAELNFVVTIVALAQGTEVQISGLGPFPAVTDKNEAWRTKMLRYVEFAIVATAQHLSSQFDGRDVRIDGKLVISWRKSVEEESFTKGPPKYTMSYGSGASLGEWKVDS